MVPISISGVKPPCTPECKRRHVGCHIDCPDYLKYQQGRKAVYEQNARNAEIGASGHAVHTQQREKRARFHQQNDRNPSLNR